MAKLIACSSRKFVLQWSAFLLEMQLAVLWIEAVMIRGLEEVVLPVFGPV